MLLRVSSYKHALVTYQINKLSTYKMKKCTFASRCSCVFYAVPCAAFFFPYQDGHKDINHSKLNDSTCAGFMALGNLDNYQEVDSITSHHLRSISLWLWHKKVADVLKYTCTNVAGSLNLPMYKCKIEETLKVPWCIPYWFVSIIRFKRSTHWPILEAGFGGMTNSWSVEAGYINAAAPGFKRHSTK